MEGPRKESPLALHALVARSEFNLGEGECVTCRRSGRPSCLLVESSICPTGCEAPSQEGALTQMQAAIGIREGESEERLRILLPDLFGRHGFETRILLRHHGAVHLEVLRIAPLRLILLFQRLQVVSFGSLPDR